MSTAPDTAVKSDLPPFTLEERQSCVSLMSPNLFHVAQALVDIAAAMQQGSKNALEHAHGSGNLVTGSDAVLEIRQFGMGKTRPPTLEILGTRLVEGKPIAFRYRWDGPGKVYHIPEDHPLFFAVRSTSR